jgi:hypothetical protein
MGTGSALSLAGLRKADRRAAGHGHGAWRRDEAGTGRGASRRWLLANPTEYAKAETIPLQTTFKFNGGAPERAPCATCPSTVTVTDRDTQAVALSTIR